MTLNSAILDTLRVNEIDPEGAEERNRVTKKKILQYREQKDSRAERRQMLLDRRLGAAEIANFRVDDPFGLDRNFMYRTLKRQEERKHNHEEHIEQILAEKSSDYGTYGYYE